MLLAEQCEARGRAYVLVHPLAVARERESARYNREKTDPRDAEWIACLASEGKIIETMLPRTTAHAALGDLAYAYFDVRRLAASARTALHNFWHRLLPEFFTIFRDATRDTALAAALALQPFSQMCRLTPEQWLMQVRSHTRTSRVQKKRLFTLHAAILAAAQQPHRRAGEGMPWRIRLAAERRRLLETQKQLLRERILKHYADRPEAVYLDSIAGADPLYNALTLGLIGEIEAFDDPRALVKLAGMEINHFQSGDMKKNTHISHRGRVRLRTAAYQQARFLVKRNATFAERFGHLMRVQKFSAQQSYVAIANSYLRTMHALVKNHEFYRATTVTNA
jgi:transposase